MKITLDLNDEGIDQLIADELKRQATYARKELKLLTKRRDSYGTEDIRYYEKLLPALELVAKYFTTAE